MTEVTAPLATPLPSAAEQEGRGPVGNPRPIGLSIVWAILTLGIYTFIWTYRTHKELFDYSRRGVGGLVGLVVYIFVQPVTFFLVPAEVKGIYRRDGRKSPVSAWLGLWFLLPVIGNFMWFIAVQRALNEFWESKGARASS
jgi:hypothetical protein